MKPVMRAEAYWAAVDDGVYVVTHDGPVRLTGRSVASWIDRVAPQLDGRRTLAELTADLAPERRAVVERLVTALHDSGVVRDAGADEPAVRAGPGPLSLAETEQYAPEIGYIGHFRGLGRRWVRTLSRPDRCSGRIRAVGRGPCVGRAALGAAARPGGPARRP